MPADAVNRVPDRSQRLRGLRTEPGQGNGQYVDRLQRIIDGAACHLGPAHHLNEIVEVARRIDGGIGQSRDAAAWQGQGRSGHVSSTSVPPAKHPTPQPSLIGV